MEKRILLLSQYLPREVAVHEVLPFLFTKCEKCRKYLNTLEMEYCETNKNYYRCDSCLLQLCVHEQYIADKPLSQMTRCEFKGTKREFHETRFHGFPEFYCTKHIPYHIFNRYGNFCLAGGCNCSLSIKAYLNMKKQGGGKKRKLDARGGS